MIIDHILKILQYDVGKLFKNSDSCLCCLKFSVPFTNSKQNSITNKYEPRPKIIDGDAVDEVCEITATTDNDCETGEDTCEDTCGDTCDDAEPTCKSVCAEETKQSPKCKLQSTCRTVCQRILQMIWDKCSTATSDELEAIEGRAVQLWQTLNASARNCNNKYPNWWDLKSWQKLPFYWAALSNEILCEEPCENFKRFYRSTSQSSSRRSNKKQTERALIIWHSLNSKQRMPFIMEAFISKVAVGKVDMRDEHDIQRVIGDLLRY